MPRPASIAALAPAHSLASGGAGLTKSTRAPRSGPASARSSSSVPVERGWIGIFCSLASMRPMLSTALTGFADGDQRAVTGAADRAAALPEDIGAGRAGAAQAGVGRARPGGGDHVANPARHLSPAPLLGLDA